MHLPCGSPALASDLPCVYHAACSRFTMHLLCLRIGIAMHVPCGSCSLSHDCRTFAPFLPLAFDSQCLRFGTTMHLPCGSPALASDLPCIYHAAPLPWPRMYHALTMRPPSDFEAWRESRCFDARRFARTLAIYVRAGASTPGVSPGRLRCTMRSPCLGSYRDL